MILSITLLAAWALSTWVRVVGSLLTKIHFKEPRKTIQYRNWKDYPPVSIIKPVKAVTPGLIERLKSNITFTYPKYELLLCCSKGDPAIPALKALALTWRGLKPHHMTHMGCQSVRLLMVHTTETKNPKSQLLRAAYHNSRYEHLLVSDENVNTKSGYLENLIQDYMENPAGLFSQAVIYVEDKGLGGRLERAYLNGLYAPGIILCSYFSLPAVMGKALFFNKKTFSKAATFDQLEETMAEDYEFGRLVKKAGFSIAISREPLECSTATNIPLYSAWHRLLRWSILRKYHEPIAFILEPFASSLFSSCMGAYAISQFSNHPIIFFFVSFLIWFVSEVNLCPHTTLIGFLIREITQIPLWLSALFCRHVHWRGNHYKIGYRGKIGAKKSKKSKKSKK